MTPGDEHRPWAALWHACGLGRPAPGRWAWLADAHVIAGVLAAVPVWLALALGAGGRLRAADTLAAWMSLVVVQPLVEEIAMRGVLQGRLLERAGAHRVGPFSVANLATSACFVALHLPAQPVAWALSTAVPSLLLGHLRERLGSVWPAVALHALYNAGFGLAALAARA